MTTPDPVRIGLIGAGRIGTHHATTLARRLPEAELVAVADPFEASARRLGAALGVEWLTDSQALIDDPRVEAVAITCASTAHADLVVAAARAGKAVFVEKPMAMTLADADRAIDAAERGRHTSAGGLQPQVRARLRDGPRRRHGRRHRHAAAPAVADPRPGPRQPGSSATVDDLHPDAHPRLRRAQLAQPRRHGGRGQRHGRRARRPRLQGRRAARHRRRHDPLRQRRARGRGGELLGRLRLRRARRGLRLGGHGDRGQPGPPRDEPLERRRSLEPDRAHRHRPLRRRVCRRAGRLLRCRSRGHPDPRRWSRRPRALRIALACIESVETGGTVTIRDTDRVGA